MINPTSRVRSHLTTVAILAFLFIAGYAIIYYASITEPLHSLMLGVFDVVTAFMTALTATLVYKAYQREDPPYRVWQNFSIGFWFWVAAEIIFLFSLPEKMQFPAVLMARILWFLAYIPFTIALNIQYHLIYEKTPTSRIFPFAVWLSVFGISYLIVAISGTKTALEDFFVYFIGFANLIVGVIALRLVLTFRGGLMARPWWGFLIFVLADVLYAVFFFLGGNEIQTLANFATHVVYLVAYLTLAIGFYLQYLLLKFGSDPLVSHTS